MRITTTPAVVAAFRAAYDLREPGPASHEAAQIIAATAETGSTGLIEVDSVLLGMDGRVTRLATRELMAVFGIEPQWFYRRPRYGERQAFGIERVTATDLAHLMILMERCGFAIDPGSLCLRLRPALTSKRLLTAPEMAIYWHARERHRMEPITLVSGPNAAHGQPADTLRTGTGYRVECRHDEAGIPVALTITPPGRRRASLAA